MPSSYLNQIKSWFNSRKSFYLFRGIILAFHERLLQHRFYLFTSNGMFRAFQERLLLKRFNLFSSRAMLLTLTSLLLISNTSAQSQQQIPTGTWRSHLSYKNAQICEASTRFVYSASENGFWRTNDFGETTVLKKTDGFNGLEVSSLGFSQEKNTLFIGYSDGNIDLLINDSRIINIPGFKNKLLQGDKQILHVSFFQNDAIVSTYFGLLIIDLNKGEIRDSYTSIGDMGTEIPVFSSCISNDSIFIATQNGIRKARWNRIENLNDFNRWSWAYKRNRCSNLASFNDTVFFETDSLVWKYNRGNINILRPDKRKIARIFNTGNSLHVVRQGEIFRINNLGYSTTSINIVSSATWFNNNYWFCTGIGPGVIKKELNNEYSFMPNGPDRASVFDMSKSGNLLLVTGGGVSSTFGNAFNNSGFYLYDENGWKSNLESPFNQNMYDFTFALHRKIDNHLFAATHSNGILEFKGKEIIQRYDNTNSPLKRIGDSSFIHIGGMAEDSKGNLWIVNYNEEFALLKLTRSTGIWNKFKLSQSNIKKLVIDDQDRKWMLLTDGGILVFHEGKNIDSDLDDEYLKLSQSEGLITPDVLSLCADKNGYVWIGTNQGLNVFTGSYDFFSGIKLDRFIVEQDGAVGYLMGEETINDILVDGGNRKWMATNNGVFCIDEFGQRVIRHFTIENSPLISNRVRTVGQLSNTSEIFMGTDKGIVSYRNDAGFGSDQFDKVVIYPNPVPPKFDGFITIEGLANNADVKIVDLQGKVVYQTKANGSKATWSGVRFDGSRPNSGVYFVLAINSDGSETAMGKFVFIK